MDLDAEAERFSIGVSAVLCGVSTIIYLFCDFEEHQPLFYIFLWLSFSVLALEYGERFLIRVVGESALLKVKNIAQSPLFIVGQGLGFLSRLRRDQRTTFFWTLNCFFVALYCVSRQMDDASVVYAACVLLGSSPIIRKLLGHGTQQLASRLFHPPASEPTELAEYMPHINEVSRDFSIRMRRSSYEKSEADMDISVFDVSALNNLDGSCSVSLMRESQFLPVMAESMSSSKATDDDTSPIPSDVEVVDADDIPEDFPASIASGRLVGDFTSGGTLRRHRQENNRKD
ncbi:uncharacterized protein LOC129581908 [Paramacrobiotus metropolitanus]|uniref:uncharacterized protein LOC129581908 n=1 Tax=Paramacrobiotus metropolitanus TaxID=2943436 RepID=UPI0024462870|nr:uncharacterized protein LOC129581908 [Paramacrobiotus metropolitanus]